MNYKWDLSPLYSGPDDPAISRDLNAALQMAEALSGSSRPISQDPYEFLSLIKEYEEVLSLSLRAYTYAELCLYCHVTDPTAKELYHQVRERWIEVKERLRKVEARLTPGDGIPPGWFKTCPPLRPYKRWLKKLAALVSHQPKDAKGVSKWKALLRRREELLSRYRGLVSETKTASGLSLSKAFSLLDDSKASRCQELYGDILDGAGQKREEFARVLGSLVQNRLDEARLRGFPSPLKKLWLLNEMGEGFAKQVIQLVGTRYDIVRNYLALVAKSIGARPFSIVDLHMLGGDKSWKGSPGDALKLVSSIAGRLDPILSGLLDVLITRGCLDLEPRPTKRQGAICRALVPSIPPYIMMNYGGGWKDLATLVHEVGHAIHYMLSSERGCLNFRPVPVLEETMATFFEVLVLFEYFAREGKKGAGSIVMDRLIKILFRQNIITELELWLYQEGDTLTSLDAQEISDQWLLLNRRLYGAEVEIPEPFGLSWALIPHIFERPFYCSNYVAASLLALNLLNCEIQEPGNFPAKLIRLLRVGSSRPAPDILGELIPGLENMAFLERAFAFMEKMLTGLGN